MPDPSLKLAHKIEVLRGHCADVGRDPAEIDITSTSALDDDLERMRTCAGLGVGQVWVSVPPEAPTAVVERACAEVLPELAKR